MQSSARTAESLAREAHSYAASLAGDPELTAAYNAACSAAANIFTPNAPGNVFIPAYWIDEWSMIPEDSAATFTGLAKMLQMVDAGGCVGGVIGLVIFLFGLISLCCGRRN